MTSGPYVVSRLDSEFSQLRLQLGVFEDGECEKYHPRLACQDAKFGTRRVKQKFGAVLFESFLVIQLSVALRFVSDRTFKRNGTILQFRKFMLDRGVQR